MSVYVGDRVELGVGREATRGTGVSAALWIPAASFDFQQKINSQNVAGSYGKLIGSQTSKILQKFGQGKIGMDLRANAVGYFLTQLFGDIDSALTATSVYTHTFNLTDSNTHPTLSIYIKDPNKSERFKRAALESLDFKFAANALATIEASFMSESPADDASTPDFTTTDYVFSPGTMTAKVAATQADLAAASAFQVNNMNMTITKGADPNYGSGSNTISDVYNTALEIKGTFERVFDGDTEHDYVFANTPKALRMAWTDTGTTIGAASNPSLTFDLYNVTFTNHSRAIQLGQITRQTIEFTGHLNISDGKVMTATLVNTKANYTS